MNSFMNESSELLYYSLNICENLLHVLFNGVVEGGVL